MKASSFVFVGLLVAGCRQPSPAQAPISAGLAEPSAAAVQAEAAILADADEPGERLEFRGRVLNAQGEPVAGTSILAWQTDVTGLYNRPGENMQEPRLRADAITDENGGFRFSTIRPGAYPDGGNPQHIHLTIRAPGHDLMYTTYWFDDDPILTPELRNNLDGETVIIALSQDEDGTWTFSHDIRLEGK